MIADNYHSVEYFPDGRPIPPLLTEEEAITLLRLDTDGPGDPSRSLKHYRDKGLLHATQIGKNLRYSKKELLRFIDEMTERKTKK
jgi:hypothetical protein